MVKKLTSIILCINMLLLTACSAGSISDGIDVMLGNKQVQQSDTAQVLTPAPTEGLHTLTFDDNFHDGGYYYNLLQDSLKIVYQTIYRSFESEEKTCTLPDLENSDIVQAYKYVLFDHPELYYIDGFQLERTESSAEVVLRPNYTKTAEEHELVASALQTYETNLFNSFKAEDDWETVRGIYDYIVTNTVYDISGDDLSNICSVIMNNRAVCEGYAKTMMYFCNKAGIDCIVVPGYIRTSGVAHLWNAVKLNNQWYFVDVTWGDQDFENEKCAPEVRYDYLCVSQDQIHGTHQFENNIAPPQCISTDMNYYYKTGKVVNEVSAEKFKALFSNFSDITDKKIVAFACSDAGVYQQVIDYLVNQKHIFDYLPSKKIRLGYMTNNNVWSMTFWIQE